jgi:PAS domain S-box-containing protein
MWNLANSADVDARGVLASSRPVSASVQHTRPGTETSRRDGSQVSLPSSPFAADSELRAALDAETQASLPLVAAGLGALFAVFAVSHALLLPRFAAMPMVLVASATAVTFLVASWALYRHPPPSRWAHPLATAGAALILLNSLLHLYLLSEPVQTTNVMLLLIGAGCFFLSSRWLAVVIVTALLGWSVVMWTAPPAPDWRHFGFALLTSTVLSVLVHAVRVRALCRLQGMLIQDELRQAELAAALASSEASKGELVDMIRAVQESEERFRRFTDLEGTAVHANGKILDANPALARMFQYEPARIIGMDVRDLVAPEARDDVAQRLSGEFQNAYETIGLRQDGVRLPIELCGKAVPYQGRRASVLMFRDITERKNAEDALREADRRKDEFLAMLGHELRSPLASIRNAAHVLGTIDSEDPMVQHAREMIPRQLAHMTRLVDDLLDVSRISRGKIFLLREQLDLVQVIRAATDDHREFARAAGLRLTSELPPEPLWVLGDSTRLSQVIGNVLRNACKFTDAGGCVSVHVKRAGATAISHIRDTGIGIDPALLEPIFEPFHQADHSLGRSPGGLGLGLALVKGLVQAHGGKVWATSEGLDSGSTFTIELPLAPGAAVPTPAKAAAVSKRSCHLLLVEDNTIR